MEGRKEKVSYGFTSITLRVTELDGVTSWPSVRYLEPEQNI